MEGKSENKILEFPPKKGTEGLGGKLLDRVDRINDNLDYVKSICHLCFAYCEGLSQLEPDVIMAVMQDAERRIEKIEQDVQYIWKKKS